MPYPAPTHLCGGVCIRTAPQRSNDVIYAPCRPADAIRPDKTYPGRGPNSSRFASRRLKRRACSTGVARRRRDRTESGGVVGS
jgi:hypothetical protein